jgi:hypothetical protein
MIAGCHNIVAGCIVPPINVSAGNTQAEDQQTRIIDVHVETPRSCARFRHNKPQTTRILEQNGSRR